MQLPIFIQFEPQTSSYELSELGLEGLCILTKHSNLRSALRSLGRSDADKPKLLDSNYLNSISRQFLCLLWTQLEQEAWKELGYLCTQISSPPSQPAAGETTQAVLERCEACLSYICKRKDKWLALETAPRDIIARCDMSEEEAQSLSSSPDSVKSHLQQCHFAAHTLVDAWIDAAADLSSILLDTLAPTAGLTTNAALAGDGNPAQQHAGKATCSTATAQTAIQLDVRCSDLWLRCHRLYLECFSSLQTWFTCRSAAVLGNPPSSGIPTQARMARQNSPQRKRYPTLSSSTTPTTKTQPRPRIHSQLPSQQSSKASRLAPRAASLLTVVRRSAAVTAGLRGHLHSMITFGASSPQEVDRTQESFNASLRADKISEDRAKDAFSAAIRADRIDEENSGTDFHPSAPPFRQSLNGGPRGSRSAGPSCNGAKPSAPQCLHRQTSLQGGDRGWSAPPSSFLMKQTSMSAFPRGLVVGGGGTSMPRNRSAGELNFDMKDSQPQGKAADRGTQLLLTCLPSAALVTDVARGSVPANGSQTNLSYRVAATMVEAWGMLLPSSLLTLYAQISAVACSVNVALLAKSHEHTTASSLAMGSSRLLLQASHTQLHQLLGNFSPAPPSPTSTVPTQQASGHSPPEPTSYSSQFKYSTNVSTSWEVAATLGSSSARMLRLGFNPALLSLCTSELNVDSVANSVASAPSCASTIPAEPVLPPPPPHALGGLIPGQGAAEGELLEPADTRSDKDKVAGAHRRAARRDDSCALGSLILLSLANFHHHLRSHMLASHVLVRTSLFTDLSAPSLQTRAGGPTHSPGLPHTTTQNQRSSLGGEETYDSASSNHQTLVQGEAPPPIKWQPGASKTPPRHEIQVWPSLTIYRFPVAACFSVPQGLPVGPGVAGEGHSRLTHLQASQNVSVSLLAHWVGGVIQAARLTTQLKPRPHPSAPQSKPPSAEVASMALLGWLEETSCTDGEAGELSLPPCLVLLPQIEKLLHGCIAELQPLAAFVLQTTIRYPETATMRDLCLAQSIGTSLTLSLQRLLELSLHLLLSLCHSGAKPSPSQLIQLVSQGTSCSLLSSREGVGEKKGPEKMLHGKEGVDKSAANLHVALAHPQRASGMRNLLRKVGSRTRSNNKVLPLTNGSMTAAALEEVLCWGGASGAPSIACSAMLLEPALPALGELLFDLPMGTAKKVPEAPTIVIAATTVASKSGQVPPSQANYNPSQAKSQPQVHSAAVSATGLRAQTGATAETRTLPGHPHDWQRSGDASGSGQQGLDASGSDRGGGDASGSEQQGRDASGSEQQGGDASGSEQRGGDASGSEQRGEDASGSEQRGGDASGSEQSSSKSVSPDALAHIASSGSAQEGTHGTGGTARTHRTDRTHMTGGTKGTHSTQEGGHGTAGLVVLQEMASYWEPPLGSGNLNAVQQALLCRLQGLLFAVRDAVMRASSTLVIEFLEVASGVYEEAHKDTWAITSPSTQPTKGTSKVIAVLMVPLKACLVHPQAVSQKFLLTAALTSVLQVLDKQLLVSSKYQKSISPQTLAQNQLQQVKLDMDALFSELIAYVPKPTDQQAVLDHVRRGRSDSRFLAHARVLAAGEQQSRGGQVNSEGHLGSKALIELIASLVLRLDAVETAWAQHLMSSAVS